MCGRERALFGRVVRRGVPGVRSELRAEALRKRASVWAQKRPQCSVVHSDVSHWLSPSMAYPVACLLMVTLYISDVRLVITAISSDEGIKKDFTAIRK